MEITEIKVFPVREEKLRAFVSIVLDRCFMVNDIKIIEGRDGLFISMPSRRRKNGSFKDVAHPLNNDTRSWLEGHILAAYESRIGGEPCEAPDSRAPEAPGEERGTSGAGAGESLPEEGTLEEVQERHLSDSFWSVS